MGVATPAPTQSAAGNAIGFKAGSAIPGMGGASVTKVGTFFTGKQMQNLSKIGIAETAASGLSQGVMQNLSNQHGIGITAPVSSINLNSFTPTNHIDSSITASDDSEEGEG